MPLSALLVLWPFDLQRVGLGFSASTTNPNQHSVHPKGSRISLLHLWPTTTTAEADTTLQLPSLFPGLTKPAPCYTKWRGAIVYALTFWAAQTLAVNDLIGVEVCTVPNYSPHKAVKIIQSAYLTGTTNGAML
jgi:hypothetical protein